LLPSSTPPTSKIGELKNGFFEARGKVVQPAAPLEHADQVGHHHQRPQGA